MEQEVQLTLTGIDLPDRMQRLSTTTKVSISRIRQSFPKLQFVKDDEIMRWYVRLHTIMQHDEKCKSCKKSDAEMQHCCKEYVTSEGGRIVISEGPCPQRGRQKKEQEMSLLVKKARIVGRYADKKFSNFEVETHNKAAYLLCKSYSESFPRENGLFLSGPTGTGKTHLALSVLMDNLERGHTGLFVTVPDFLDEIKASFAPGADRTEIMSEAKNVELLVLDDMGTEKLTDFVAEQIFTLINHRYIHKLPTIVTSNLNITDLAERIGPRVSSRLREMCSGITVNGPDYRARRKRSGSSVFGGSPKGN